MNSDASRPTSSEGKADSEAVSDIELVKRCQNGDTAAFDELVTRHRARVFTMVYNMVRNEQDAWDLAQESFVKAWKSIGRFRGQSAFYTWLYRIVSNVTIDWIRKRKIESGTEFDDAVGLGDVETGAATAPRPEYLPDQQLGHAEIRSRIDEAIARLSPDHRAVILLKEMDGLQYHEIAEVMECSIGTVMSRLFYARKKLQAMLKDVYENI